MRFALVLLLAWFIPPIPWVVPLELLLGILVMWAAVRAARNRPCF